MMYAQISPMKIDDIYITHLHGDHILGLPGLIQSLAFRGRTRPLNIYGPEGIDQLLEHIKHLGFASINYEIITHTVVDDSIIYKQDDFIVRSKKMKHTVTDYAYMIEEIRQPKFIKSKALELNVPPGPLFGKLQAGYEVTVDGVVIKPEQVLGPPRKGVKLVFSGDTIPQESMIEFARGVDVLIHEATFSKEYADNAKENGHTIAEDAAKIAKEADVEQLILTHLSNRYTDSNELLNEAKAVFENTVYAHDFMTVIIENKKAVRIISNK